VDSTFWCWLQEVFSQRCIVFRWCLSEKQLVNFPISSLCRSPCVCSSFLSLKNLGCLTFCIEIKFTECFLPQLSVVEIETAGSQQLMYGLLEPSVAKAPASSHPKSHYDQGPEQCEFVLLDWRQRVCWHSQTSLDATLGTPWANKADCLSEHVEKCPFEWAVPVLAFE